MCWWQLYDVGDSCGSKDVTKIEIESFGNSVIGQHHDVTPENRHQHHCQHRVHAVDGDSDVGGFMMATDFRCW